MVTLELPVLFLSVLFFVTCADAGSYCYLYSNSGYYYKYCSAGCCGSGNTVYCCDYDVNVGLIIGLIFLGILIFSCIVCVVICVVVKQKHYGRVFNTPAGAPNGHTTTGVTVDSHMTSGHMFSRTNVTTTSGQFPAPPSYSATYLPPPTQPGYTVSQQNYPAPPPYSYGTGQAYNQ